MTGDQNMYHERCVLYLSKKHLSHTEIMAIEHSIVILPSERLANFKVVISNVSLMVTSSQLLGSDFITCGQYTSYPPGGATGRVTCSPGPIRGRFVHITLPQPESLTLCEVMVLSPEGTWMFGFPTRHSKNSFARREWHACTIYSIAGCF